MPTRKPTPPTAGGLGQQALLDFSPDLPAIRAGTARGEQLKRPNKAGKRRGAGALQQFLFGDTGALFNTSPSLTPPQAHTSPSPEPQPPPAVSPSPSDTSSTLAVAAPPAPPVASTTTPSDLTSNTVTQAQMGSVLPASIESGAAGALSSRPAAGQQKNFSLTGNGVIRINGIEFHHASEAEFARLLTYYGIDWNYEPNQFALQWRDGQPTEMFAPDFYLPEYDLYIELTTMRQSLVRRKNRKLRLLRALYPDINIKLLYRRDYQRLLERFGIRPEEVVLPGEHEPGDLDSGEDDEGSEPGDARAS